MRSSKYLPVLQNITTLLIIGFYAAYLAFIVANDQGAVDYETFMEIGERFLNGQKIWGENSYYPLPYVMIFAFFAALPRWLSIIGWHLPLVIVVLLILGWRSTGFLFAPTLGHFMGGQSSLPGLLGFWKYRESSEQVEDWRGGAWLAVTTFKPQIGLAPILWAVWTWWQVWRREKTLTPQMWGFLGGTGLIYLPAFLIIPSWVGQWLESPREVKERAIATPLPRLFFSVLNLPDGLGFVLLLGLSIPLFYLVWRLNGKEMSLEVFVLFTLLVNPLIHDYDLIFLLPLLKDFRMGIVAVLVSLPTLVVIFFAYNVDAAWGVAVLTPLGMLIAKLVFNRADRPPGSLAD